MLIAGITAEYNPFHNGHAFHIEETRRNGAEAVVAVMSSNFVQRGEPAVLSKWARAQAAVKNGVDLVLELPVIWSCGNAQSFARGAVSILNALGCIDILSFGSECGDTELLQNAVKAIESTDFSSAVKESLKDGITFAKAREIAVRSICGEDAAAVLKNPNDALAVEYLSALRHLQSKIQPSAIKRSVAHDSNEASNEMASASLIRQKLLAEDDISSLVPKESLEIINREISLGLAPVSYKALETSALMAMRTASVSDFVLLPDVSEGLENRLKDASRTALTLDELYLNAKTKRYSHARIRRLVLHKLLGITDEMQTNSPPYIKVLALNETGRQILRAAKEKSTLPIIMRSSEIGKLSGFASTVFETESRVTDIYALAFPQKQGCGLEFTKQVFFDGQ